MGDSNLSGSYKKKFLLVLFLLAIMICGCGNSTAGFSTDNIPKGTLFRVYFMNTAGTKLQSVDYMAENKEAKSLVSELISQLSKPPEAIGLKQAVPDDISVLSYDIQGETVTLHFGENYNALTGVTEVLRRAAVVKTLTQIEGIKFVKYTVGEQPLLYSDMIPVGSMKADDFIDNKSGETTYYQTVHLILYYTDEMGRKLIPARHNVEFDGTISMENLVLKQLINGPLPAENLMAVIPEGTKVNKVSSKDGICYVDFSKEFLSGIDGVSNRVIIYSVINSLSEIGSVTKVVITVEGEVVSTYRGEIPIDLPLERKLELIENN